jgi:transcription initiation factor IIE alpha subunit
METIQAEPKKYPYKTDYYRKFKESHNVNQKQTCEICGGSFTYYMKSTHNKSKKHQIALLVNQPEKLAEYLKIKKTP